MPPKYEAYDDGTASLSLDEARRFSAAVRLGVSAFEREVKEREGGGCDRPNMFYVYRLSDSKKNTNQKERWSSGMACRFETAGSSQDR